MSHRSSEIIFGTKRSMLTRSHRSISGMMAFTLGRNKVILELELRCPYHPLMELLEGCVDVVPYEDLRQKLARSKETGVPLRVKFGADPSRPDMHLGHTVVLEKLRQFQDAGHRVQFLIGNFTAQIGDPTGRSKARVQIDAGVVEQNSRTYEAQVFKILDRTKTDIFRNSDWLSSLQLKDFLGILQHVTAGQVMSREDFSVRMKAQQPIYMHEFLYPILQGYDSVVLKSDIELGGTDQTFNLLMGRTLQKAFGQEPQVVMTMPLLEGTDGIQKMSKSADNIIALDEDPRSMFGKLMAISDSLMWRYYALLSRATDIQKFHPMEAKKRLATEIVDRFSGQGAKEREYFESVFSKKNTVDAAKDMVVVPDAEGCIDISSLLVAEKLITSKSGVRRLLQQKAIRADGVVLEQARLPLGDASVLLKVGKLIVLRLIKK